MSFKILLTRQVDEMLEERKKREEERAKLKEQKLYRTHRLGPEKYTPNDIEVRSY